MSRYAADTSVSSEKSQAEIRTLPIDQQHKKWEQACRQRWRACRRFQESAQAGCCQNSYPTLAEPERASGNG